MKQRYRGRFRLVSSSWVVKVSFLTPHQVSVLRMPEKRYMTVSISGEIWFPDIQMSSAVFIDFQGMTVEEVTKPLDKGYPSVVDVIREGRVNAVINTPEGRITETLRDGFEIRRAAAEKRIPCLTSIDTAAAAVHSLVAEDPQLTIQPLRDYLRK